MRARIAYDGSRFFGWQRQDGFDSVQQALEEAVESLTGTAVVVHGAGRTDTGVHAIGQVANFHTDTRLDDNRLLHALNAHLVPGVAVTALETCRDDFHARFDARGKRYLYHVLTSAVRPPFAHDLSHWVREPLDLDAVRTAARALEGRRDFSALASAGSPRSSNVRNVRAVRVVARRTHFALVVEGDGFLYNMVRAIAGTLIDVGRGRIAAERVGAILESLDRTEAGPTAPARGLWLLKVLYREPVLVRRTEGPRGAAGLFPR
ncbi:MAG: tRNA pseudouridine(38-40) synthase TruA [Planctomycetota bacterium]